MKPKTMDTSGYESMHLNSVYLKLLATDVT